jgi:puromycin-sensitive aminopeptidase
MENWGLVTYREAKVLVEDDGSTSESARRGIARTVCHELAHQWFGNLVTPDTWSRLWLKEGMARYLEFVAADHLFPAWGVWTEFAQSVAGTALQLDAFDEPTTHPVEVPVGNPDEINDIFDAISYAKGASLVRMIASHVGPAAFFRGLRTYLERHAYANAASNDLWGALEESSGGFPVVEFMAPWTLTSGYPLLELLDEGDGAGKTETGRRAATIRVSRFLAGGRATGGGGAAVEPTAPSPSPWAVPVTAIVQGVEGVQGPFVMNGPGGLDDTPALLDKIEEWSAQGRWFKLNAGQAGFFRVSYTASQWARLAPTLDPGAAGGGGMSTSDRLGLLSDSFAAGRAGYVPLANSLELVSGFGSHDTAGECPSRSLVGQVKCGTGPLFVPRHSSISHVHRLSTQSTRSGRSSPTTCRPLPRCSGPSRSTLGSSGSCGSCTGARCGRWAGRRCRARTRGPGRCGRWSLA